MAPPASERRFGRGQIRLVQGDITRVPADAVVNAANSGLLGGGGVDGAIHRAAGPALLEECRRVRAALGPCPPGSAVATGAGALPARFVLHAVGPVWRGGTHGEPAALASAYRAVVRLADERSCRTLSLPALSTGAYGYPPELAAPVALLEVRDALLEAALVEEATFVLQPEGVFRAFQSALSELV